MTIHAQLCLPLSLLTALAACAEGQPGQGLSAGSAVSERPSGPVAPILDEARFAHRPLSPERQALLALAAAELRSAEGMMAQAVRHNDGLVDALAWLTELAHESASETLDDDERAYIQQDYEAEIARLDGAAQSARWGALPLADGTVTILEVDLPESVRSELTGHVGVQLVDQRMTTLGLDTATIDLSTATAAQSAIDRFSGTVDAAMTYRGTLSGGVGTVDGALARVLRRLGGEQASLADPLLDLGRAELQAGLALVDELDADHAEVRGLLDRMVALAEEAALADADGQAAADAGLDALIQTLDARVSTWRFDDATVHDGTAESWAIALPGPVHDLGIADAQVALSCLTLDCLRLEPESLDLTTKAGIEESLAQLWGAVVRLDPAEQQAITDRQVLERDLDWLLGAAAWEAE